MQKTTIVIASLIGTSGWAMAAAPFEVLFLRSEAQRGVYELQLAQLGDSRAVRPEVRAYAATLVNDHEAFNSALRELAIAKGIAVPSALAPSDKKRLDELAGKSGAAFDGAFIREAQRVNAADIRAFRGEASHVTGDPEVHSFVTHFLKVDEKHAAEARELGGHDVASHAAASKRPAPNTSAVKPPSGAHKDSQ